MRLKNTSKSKARFALFLAFMLFSGVISAYAGTSTAGKSDNIASRVCSLISEGDFDSAGSVLDGYDTDSANLSGLKSIVSQYQQMQAKRHKDHHKVYLSQIEKFDKLRESASDDDFDKFDKAFAIIVKAIEYATDDEKGQLLDDKLVKTLVKKTEEKGQRLAENGDWRNAYSKCYFWLNELYPENSGYRDMSDALMDKNSIELSLQDAHGETSLQRHADIKPRMLLLAVKKLDFDYADLVDYPAMIEAALGRCRALGEVLKHSKKELSYSVEARDLRRWKGGLNAAESSLRMSAGLITREVFLKVFKDVLALNKITLKLPEEVLTAHFSEASLLALDPYTGIIWPKKQKEFHKSVMREFTGIGIRLSGAGKSLKIVSLLPNSPAYSSGLDAGDVILAIDGELTGDMTVTDAVSRISGPKGSKVTLTVRHITTDQTEDITIVRDKIVVSPIGSWQRAEEGKWQAMIDPENGIGYIKIDSFVKTTIPSMQKMLNGMESQGLNGLIIDLRFNRGGLLSSAVEMVDMFVKAGPILKSVPRWGLPSYKIAHSKGTHPDYPLVVLINGASASASEIVSGALQDPIYKRAAIVGSRSYGKGSVQEIVPFRGDKTQLKYTTAYYHLPSNKRVKNRYLVKRAGDKDWGITPDVNVTLKSGEITKLIEMQSVNRVLSKTDRNGKTTTVKRYSLKEMIAADPQLATGLFVIKAKMIEAGQKLKP
ncbi:MAG TPA: S41 family peptidase [Phycisphaerales bacterium]|nr:S41 family peptidase [Phycisphaerales bacterium]